MNSIINKHVWHGTLAEVAIYFDDGEGNRLNEAGGDFDPVNDLPLSRYCYWEQFSIQAVLPKERRPVTGRPQLKIVTQAYEYSASVEFMALQFNNELDHENVFKRNQPLQFEFLYVDWTGANAEEIHVLSICYCDFSVQTQSNDVVTGSLSVMAERFS